MVVQGCVKHFLYHLCILRLILESFRFKAALIFSCSLWINDHASLLICPDGGNSTGSSLMPADCISSFLEISVAPPGQGTSHLALIPCWDSEGPRFPSLCSLAQSRDRNYRPCGGAKSMEEKVSALLLRGAVCPSSHLRRNTWSLYFVHLLKSHWNGSTSFE